MNDMRPSATVSGRSRGAAPAQTIGVLICSYRRPDSLLRGLAALAAQQRLPDDVLVVARADDVATLRALASCGIIGTRPVSRYPGCLLLLV